MIYLNENKFIREFINILDTHIQDEELRECVYVDLIQYMIDADADFKFKSLKKLDKAFDKAAEEFALADDVEFIEDDDNS